MQFHEVFLTRIKSPKRAHFMAGVTDKIEANQQPECSFIETKDAYGFLIYLRNKKDAENVVNAFKGLNDERDY